MPVFKTRIGRFVAISLGLHAAILLGVHNGPPVQNWLAGPVVVRLLPAPESTPQSGPVHRTKADSVMEPTGAPAARQAATTAENIPSQRRPARLADPPPARLEQHVDTAAAPEPAQRRSAEAATRRKALEQQLLNSLHTALMPHFDYPLLARRRGWEGIVRVGVRVEANGRLTRLHLVEPSPYAVLNSAAINSLSRLARLPNAGNWLQGGHVDLVLPVEYRLLEG